MSVLTRLHGSCSHMVQEPVTGIRRATRNACIRAHAECRPSSRFRPKQASLFLTLNLTEQRLPLCQTTVQKQEMAVHGLALRNF